MKIPTAALNFTETAYFRREQEPTKPNQLKWSYLQPKEERNYRTF